MSFTYHPTHPSAFFHFKTNSAPLLLYKTMKGKQDVGVTEVLSKALNKDEIPGTWACKLRTELRICTLLKLEETAEKVSFCSLNYFPETSLIPKRAQALDEKPMS